MSKPNGFFQRVLHAFVENRTRRAERYVAQYLPRHGAAGER